MDNPKTFASRVERFKQQVEANEPINPHDLLAMAETVLLLGNWCQTMNASMVGQLDIAKNLMERMTNLEERLDEVEEFTEDISEDLVDVEELLGLDEEEDGDDECSVDFVEYEVDVDDTMVTTLFLHDADVSKLTDSEFNDLLQDRMEVAGDGVFTAVILDINEMNEMEEKALDEFIEDIAQTAVDGIANIEQENIAEKHF